VLALFVLTGCASSQPGASTSSPSPSVVASSQTSPSALPTASPSATATPAPPVAYGVFLKYMPNAAPPLPGPPEEISVVATDGTVVAHVAPVPRSTAPGPWLSASNSAVYFTDGDTKVRALTPDGKVRDVTTVPGGASIGSTFAVSPDDRRIAVAVLDSSANPVKALIYVEDLIGHTNHSEIYATTFASHGVGPIFQVVGWHQGHIVLFLANETAFAGYHLIDATDATRLATVCPSGWEVTGNIEPAGVLCWRNIPGSPNQWSLAVESWRGVLTMVPSTPEGPYCTGLSPRGTYVACSGQPIVVHRVADGAPVPVPASRVVLGWIDETHVVVGADTPPANVVVDITTGTAAPTTALGAYMTALPGGLD